MSFRVSFRKEIIYQNYIQNQFIYYSTKLDMYRVKMFTDKRSSIVIGISRFKKRNMSIHDEKNESTLSKTKHHDSRDINIKKQLISSYIVKDTLYAGLSVVELG